MPTIIAKSLLAMSLFGLAVLFVSPVADAAAAGRAETKTAYTLKVATYADRAAAERAAESVSDAWIEVAVKDAENVYRVNCGRYETRTDAVRAQWDLEDQGLTGTVTPIYLPIRSVGQRRLAKVDRYELP